MRFSSLLCPGVALGFLATSAEAAGQKVIIHTFDRLAISPQGDRAADVEASDPGNLPEEPHVVVVERGSDGKIAATYDPCKNCKYSDTAWSAKGDLAFIATDDKSEKATLFAVSDGKLRAVATITGVAQ